MLAVAPNRRGTSAWRTRGRGHLLGCGAPALGARSLSWLCHIYSSSGSLKADTTRPTDMLTAVRWDRAELAWMSRCISACSDEALPDPDAKLQQDGGLLWRRPRFWCCAPVAPPPPQNLLFQTRPSGHQRLFPHLPRGSARKRRDRRAAAAARLLALLSHPPGVSLASPLHQLRPRGRESERLKADSGAAKSG